MDDARLVAEEAYREAKVADHMAFVTSKIVSEKKIIVSIINHLEKSFMLSIKSLLLNERLKKRLESLPTSDSELFELFSTSYSEELKIEKSLLDTIRRLHSAVQAYDSRGIILTRADKYVFVSEDYELIDFKLDNVKDWIRQGLNFVSIIKERINN